MKKSDKLKNGEEKENSEFLDQFMEKSEHSDTKIETNPEYKNDQETSNNNIDSKDIKDFNIRFDQEEMDKLKYALDKDGVENFEVYIPKSENRWYKNIGSKFLNGVKKHKRSFAIGGISLAALAIFYFGAGKKYDASTVKKQRSFLVQPPLPIKSPFVTSIDTSNDSYDNNRSVATTQETIKDSVKNKPDNSAQKDNKQYLKFGDQEIALVPNAKDITYEQYLNAVRKRGYTGLKKLLTGEEAESKDYFGIIKGLAAKGNVNISDEDPIWEKINTNPAYRYNGINDKAYPNNVKMTYDAIQKVINNKNHENLARKPNNSLQSNPIGNSDIRLKVHVANELANIVNTQPVNTTVVDTQQISPTIITNRILNHDKIKLYSAYDEDKNKDKISNHETKRNIALKNDTSKHEEIRNEDTKKDYKIKKDEVRHFEAKRTFAKNHSRIKHQETLDTKINSMFNIKEGFSLSDPFMKEYFKTRKVDLHKLNENIAHKLKRDYNNVLSEGVSLFNKARSSGLSDAKSLDYVVKHSDKAIYNNKKNVHRAISQYNEIAKVKSKNTKNVVIFNRWNSHYLPADAKDYVVNEYNRLTDNGTKKFSKEIREELRKEVENRYSSSISETTLRRYVNPMLRLNKLEYAASNIYNKPQTKSLVKIIEERLNILKHSKGKRRLTPEMAEVINVNFSLSTVFNESTLNRYAHNKLSGASGYWQIMPTTGRQLVSNFDNVKFDPRASTMMGLNYTVDLWNFIDKNNPNFRNMSIADKRTQLNAGYHAGPGALQKAGFNISNLRNSTNVYVADNATVYSVLEEMTSNNNSIISASYDKSKNQPSYNSSINQPTYNNTQNVSNHNKNNYFPKTGFIGNTGYKLMSKNSQR